MLYAGTKPEWYITDCTLVYEDKIFYVVPLSLGIGGFGSGSGGLRSVGRARLGMTLAPLLWLMEW